MDWHYYDKNGQKQGPITGEQLRQLVQQGNILPETKVETGEGRTDVAKNVKGLVFSEIPQSEMTYPESTQEADTSELNSSVPLTPVVNKPSTSLSSEQCESVSTQESTGEIIQDVTEQPDMHGLSSVSEVPTHESAPDMVERVLSELKPILKGLNEKIESQYETIVFLKQLVDRKQASIDQLYEENRGYKDGIIEQFKKKLVLGVIEELDAAYKQIESFEGRDETEKSYKNLLSSFRDIANDFVDMLRKRLEIFAFRSVPGEKFDPERHNATSRISTGDQSQDTVINSTRRNGYANSEGTILRPAWVEVFYYDAALATTDVVDSIAPPNEISPLASPSDSNESGADK